MSRVSYYLPMLVISAVQGGLVGGLYLILRPHLPMELTALIVVMIALLIAGAGFIVLSEVRKRQK